MIPKDCKRLAEVDFPIAEVSRHAAREKVDPPRASEHAASVVGASTACVQPGDAAGVFSGRTRVIRCAQMISRNEARELLLRSRRLQSRSRQTRIFVLRCSKFIADFANWDLAANRTYLDVSRALVKAHTARSRRWSSILSPAVARSHWRRYALAATRSRAISTLLRA